MMIMGHNLYASGRCIDSEGFTHLAIISLKEFTKDKVLETKDRVRKMVSYRNNFIILCEQSGWIEIFDTIKQQMIFQQQLDHKRDIIDIAETDDPNSFMLGLK